jgi:hypothetical protein
MSVFTGPVPADQQDDLVVPCRLMLDIQAVRFEFKSRAAFMPKGRILPSTSRNTPLQDA